MPAVQLKISDLAAVAGYTRFQMHGFLDEVFPPRGGKKGRSQRTFAPQELVVVATACQLEKTFGVKRSLLATISESLRHALIRPRNANRNARLLVTFALPTATYLEHDTPVGEGLVLPLGPVFAKVDEYMGVAGSSREGGQTILALPPATVANRRTTTSRR